MTKITLRIEDELFASAEKIAAGRNTTVGALIADYLEAWRVRWRIWNPMRAELPWFDAKTSTGSDRDNG